MAPRTPYFKPAKGYLVEAALSGYGFKLALNQDINNIQLLISQLSNSTAKEFVKNYAFVLERWRVQFNQALPGTIRGATHGRTHTLSEMAQLNWVNKKPDSTGARGEIGALTWGLKIDYLGGSASYADANKYGDVQEQGRKTGGATKAGGYMVPLASWLKLNGKKPGDFVTTQEIRRDLRRPGVFLLKNKRKKPKYIRTATGPARLWVQADPKRKKLTAMYLQYKTARGVFGGKTSVQFHKKAPALKDPLGLLSTFRLRPPGAPQWFTRALAIQLPKLYSSLNSITDIPEAPGRAAGQVGAYREGKLAGSDPRTRSMNAMAKSISEQVEVLTKRIQEAMSYGIRSERV